MEQEVIAIDSSNHNQRFDRFLRKYFKVRTEVTLPDIFRGIRNRLILVNGKKSTEDYRLKHGDKVTITDKFEASGKEKKGKNPHVLPINVEKIRDMVLFEDSKWLVFDKPTGISIHPSDNEHKQRSMHDYLRAYLPKSEDPTFAPAFGYRLDKETSGVLIAAKTYDSLQYINEIIRNREINKEYMAIVVGKFPKHLVLAKSLRKSFDTRFNRGKTAICSSEDKDAKDALTEVRLERYYDHPVLGMLSLIKVHIETGRMHQIRVHCADAGYPVLGDILYGHPRINRVLMENMKIKRQFLHCAQYAFWDIFGDQKLILNAPLPETFKALMGE